MTNLLQLHEAKGENAVPLAAVATMFADYLGMPQPEDAAMRHAGRLFGVFERLHNQTEFEGTGVGLAIVRRIVERHGGAISAEGLPGEDAAFRFSPPG